MEPVLRREVARARRYDAGGGWEAFDRTAPLFRRAAKAVGDALGYAYPQRIDDLATAHLDRLRP